MRKLIALTITSLALLAVGVAPAGSTTRTSESMAKTVKIGTRDVKGLGEILVNARGLTLYMFVPDKQKKVTCVKSCAVLWPPLKVAAGAKAAVSGGAKASLLGSDPNPGGGRVVTYNKWPVYLYLPDTKPGMATGQAVNSDGGLWYALSPSGKVIKNSLQNEG
jgi:predicted lipoprotein with Yx(FWY)xxD motif